MDIKDLFDTMNSEQIQDLCDMNIEDVIVNRCNCGAYTIQVGKLKWSISNREFEQYFLDLKLNIRPEIWNSCNYCVNHWGTDICKCGSGELFSSCHEGNSCCGEPYYNIDEPIEVIEYLIEKRD